MFLLVIKCFKITRVLIIKILQVVNPSTTECHWHLIYFPLTCDGIRHSDINTCIVAETQIPKLFPVTAHTSGLSSIL